MMAVVSYHRDGEIACLTLNNPPVNAISIAVRRELLSALRQANDDTQVQAVVLRGHGRGFSAGADIREFGTSAVTDYPRLTGDVHPVIEQLEKPVVAAMHGLAIGGGLETALACHGRIAVSDTVIAFPEVSLGLIPISGTQRLPRVVSMERCLEFLLKGAKHRADEYADELLFDRVVHDTDAMYTAACELALHIRRQGPPFPLVRRLPVVGASNQAVATLDRASLNLAAASGTEAQQQAIAAVRAALESSDFDGGIERATRLCEGLLASETTKQSALRFLKKGESTDESR